MKTFDVPIIYRSPLISAIKQYRKRQDRMKKDLTPTLLDFGPLRIYLARHFGFCYGVENAIEISFKTVENNPGKNIYLLSEMIHNPQVNADLQSRGVKFLQDTAGNQLIPFETLTPDDIVIIPAFGSTLEIEQKLHNLGVSTEAFNTTCPFVEKVWNRSEQIAKKGYSVVIHGKPGHEETRATFSHASSHAPSIVIKDMEEARVLADFITGRKPAEEFDFHFKNRYSPGFDYSRDLQRFGVVNQTTQLATDTLAISAYLKKVMMEHYGLNESNIQERFADTRDTLCYATNDNQSAVTGMLNREADFAVVVGGYNSSNTTHLVELCEQKMPTYFINAADKILGRDRIVHFDCKTKTEQTTENFLPEKPVTEILMTSGASCPDAVVESVIVRLAELFEVEAKVEALAEELSKAE
jgi:4-hydroxy-3-methylbut-2-enyl diphosphate reductase